MAEIGQTASLKDGTIRHVPYKMSDSLSEFVISRNLIDAGFVAWATTRKTDFVFHIAHGSADPADYSSKRVGRLLRRAANVVNFGKVGTPLTAGTAHGFRGCLLYRLADASLQSVVGELQVGHARDAVNRSYRRLTDSQAMAIYDLRDDELIDYGVFDKHAADRLDGVRLTVAK